MGDPVSPSGGLRTSSDNAERTANANVFDTSSEPLESKLDNFPKYIRRQQLTRFLSLYEIFKLV